jgi:hypothetical protein
MQWRNRSIGSNILVEQLGQPGDHFVALRQSSSGRMGKQKPIRSEPKKHSIAVPVEHLDVGEPARAGLGARLSD